MNSLQDFKPEIKTFLLVALIAVAVSVAGILLLKTIQSAPSPTPLAQQTPLPTPTPPPPPQTLDTSDWQTYRSDEFGFEVKYPEGFVVKENVENVRGVVLGFGQPIDVLIEFPDSIYDTTSLSHGALHINRILDPEEYCGGFYDESGSPPTVKIINGISFIETSFGDGAMGLDHEEKQYNTKYEGICYQINRVIVTRGYYQEVGLTYMDRKEVERKLDQILSTFRFVESKEIMIPSNKKECEAKDGQWGVFGNVPGMSKEECALPTSDTGKLCTDSSQCESICISYNRPLSLGEKTTGICYEWDFPAASVWCSWRIEDGKATLYPCP